MDNATRTQLLIEERLGCSLADYVIKARLTQPPTSWRRIALGITERTDIDITGETVRMWFAQRAKQSERAA